MTSTLTPELICDLHAPEDVDISAGGDLVAWCAGPYGTKSQRPERNIWISRRGSSRRLRLTSGADDYSPRISPDGECVAFLSSRGDDEHAGIYRIAIDGGEAAPLWCPQRPVRYFAWSPTGSVVAALAEIEHPEPSETDALDPSATRSELVLIDAATGALLDTLDIGRHIAAVTWRPDAQAIALIAQPTTELDAGYTAEIAIVTDDFGELRTVCSAPWAEKLLWSEHGDMLTYLAPLEAEPGAGTTVWAVCATQDAQPCVIGPGVRDEECALDVAALSPTSVAIAIARGLHSIIYEYDFANRTKREILFLAGDLRSLAAAAPGHVACCVQMDGQAIEVWLGHDGALTQVSAHGATLDGVDLAPVTSFRANAADGSDLDVIAIRPATASPGPLPTVILPHGGPYGRSTLGLHCNPLDWGQWLAAAGYLVLMPNFRGGKGRGHLFAAACRADMGGADWLDVCGAIDTAVAMGITDPERLGIGGWSQGGFLSAWAVTQTTRFQAAVVGAGVSDWRMLALTSDKPRFEASLAGGQPWEPASAPPSAIADCSPISHAAAVDTPVLILHGEEDRRIPASQARAFDLALRTVGAPVVTVLYPREPHVITERDHLIDVMTRVRLWFDRHLLGPAPSTASVGASARTSSLDPLDPDR